MINAGDGEKEGSIRVMSDERGDLSVCAGHGDAPVNPPSEVRKAVLEVMMGDLHNV